MWNEALEGLVVVKRSGQRVEFNASKISVAIRKAFEAVYEDVDETSVFKVFEKVLSVMNNDYKERKTVNVEDIQDLIETTLKELKFKDVYTAFHDYRLRRAASRKAFDEKHQHKFVKAIEKVQEQAYSQKDNLTPSDIVNKFGQIISREYTKSYTLDAKYIRAMEEGSIYIHDLDYFPLGYISHLNLKVSIKETDEHLDEFISQLINVRKEVSDEIVISNIDLILKNQVLNMYRKNLKDYLNRYLTMHGFIDFIPIKKYYEAIDKTENIDDAMEELKSLCVNKLVEDVVKYAINDSKRATKKFITYAVEKILNMLRINQKPRSFVTMSISDNKDPVSLEIKDEFISFLRNNPYIETVHVIFKTSHYTNDTVITDIVGLATNNKNISIQFVRESEREYFRDSICLSKDDGISPIGRMCVTATSINMARLALKSKNKTREEFYKKLDNMLELTKNELMLSFETIGNKSKENYDVLFRGNIVGDERLEEGQKIRKIIKAGTINIGLIGLKDCILNLEKEETKQYKFLVELLEYIRKKCNQFSEDAKLNFKLFEPSGIQSRKYLMKIDKSIYGCDKSKKEETYELIHTARFIDGYKKLGEIQKYFNGGISIPIKVTNKTTSKKVIELISEINKTDIEHVTFEGDS